MSEALSGLLHGASWSRFRNAIIATIILSFTGLFLAVPSTNLPFEGSIYDILSRNLKSSEPVDSETKIVIIAIDDHSLNNPRGSKPEMFAPAQWAKVVDALVVGGVKAIAIHRNLPATESSSYPIEEEAVWFQSVQNAHRSGVPIIYGFRHRVERLLMPSVKFREVMGSQYLGFIDLVHDRDDKVRRALIRWPSESMENEPELSFAFLTARASNPDLVVDTNSYYIDYNREFVNISFADVYEQAERDQIDYFRRLFFGAVVLIGETGSPNMDAYPTPNSRYGRDNGGWSLMPAVEIQANSVNTLFKTNLLEPPNWLTLWLLFFGLTFLAMTPILLSVPRGRYLCSWVPPIMILVYPVAAFIAFRRQVFLPVIPGLSILILANLFYFVLRIRENKMIQNTSSQALNLYLNPALAGQIISNPQVLERRGELRNVTVFFADLVGYTALAESMSTEALVDMLNRYYETMNTAIERYDGYVDKFVGDAIMAVWGAPSSQPLHAVSACLSSLMQKTLMDQLNRELAASGKPNLFALMGLNTGQVIAGNIGSSHRLNYTVMGDTVNLASRLVPVNKLYKTTILASEATVNLAKDKVCFRALDQVRVKGRKGSLKVYEVLAPMGGLDDKMAQCVNYFERALKHYWNRDFTGALARFEAALKTVPSDSPSLIMAKRCQGFISNPPGPDWDGVTILEAK
ncbi:MAG: adenylate/guanylate cyclase domain-containing protein [Deltaproteobacteria bacterium]|jgi:class 3 adenylate cyclase/CHASE2 domain-containing sensor protein|nr:adenylate/guanylate cyclase domain-containing protein [Deltaproteobacteria bacterium]